MICQLAYQAQHGSHGLICPASLSDACRLDASLCSRVCPESYRVEWNGRWHQRELGAALITWSVSFQEDSENPGLSSRATVYTYHVPVNELRLCEFEVRKFVYDILTIIRLITCDYRHFKSSDQDETSMVLADMA